jgi:hypothetical protein
MTVHASVEAHTLSKRLIGNGCLEHYPRIYYSMLLADTLFVYALLSIVYGQRNNMGLLRCGIYATYGHFNVSRLGTGPPALRASQVTFVIDGASHLFGMV